jgi:hypothetical protein
MSLLSFFQNKESGLKWILDKFNGDMDWIHLAHERSQPWAFVNMEMNPQFP